MKYTKDERVDIGRQVYMHELTHDEAITKYGIVGSSVDNYVQMYKIKNGIPTNQHITYSIEKDITFTKSSKSLDIETYKAMSKEELINELIRSKANELRAKKGYEVKGVGVNKEFISLSSKNTKS